MEKNCLFGKHALVVGGSGGIGREISLLLSKYCASISVHGSRESKKFDSLLQKIESSCAAKKIICDFSSLDFESAESAALFEEAKNCDILCVCFGPFVQKTLLETSELDWKTVALLDYALPGALVSRALPRMVAHSFGRILLFGGTGTSHRAEFFTTAAYSGAKAGVGVIVSSCAAFYAKNGITCNAILPGFTLTEYTEHLDFELASKMPLKRQISAKTIAKTALFLLQNEDINGAILRVDQGWTNLTAEK